MDELKKQEAQAILDANITSAPKKTHLSRKYTSIEEFSPDGVHFVRLDEYKGELGVGYTRIVYLEDPDDTSSFQIFKEHVGPEKYRNKYNGWTRIDKGIH